MHFPPAFTDRSTAPRTASEGLAPVLLLAIALPSALILLLGIAQAVR